MAGPNYKFNEDQILKELQEHIDATYNQHYSHTKFQATEFIFDNGHGEGFCIGNIMKYAQRYGKKDGRNRKDLMKILHYAIMLVHVHDTHAKPVTEDSVSEPAFPTLTTVDTLVNTVTYDGGDLTDMQTVSISPNDPLAYRPIKF